MIEAIDDKNFYLLASTLDNLSISSFYDKFREICLILFNKTEINKWLGENRLKSKHNGFEQNYLLPLKEIIASLKEDNLCMKMRLLNVLSHSPKYTHLSTSNYI